jgi:hypothetical protein
VSSTSSAAREPGEATTRALSVAYELRSDAALLCICRAARGGLVGHGPVTSHTPGCYVGAQGTGKGGAGVVWVSLEVLC